MPLASRCRRPLQLQLPLQPPWRLGRPFLTLSLPFPKVGGIRFPLHLWHPLHPVSQAGGIWQLRQRMARCLNEMDETDAAGHKRYLSRKLDQLRFDCSKREEVCVPQVRNTRSGGNLSRVLMPHS